MNLSKYKKLKRMVEEKKQERDRAEGALQSLLTQLKRDHGCSTLKEAKQLYKKLQKEEAEAELAFEDKLSAFESKWKGRINGSESDRE